MIQTMSGSPNDHWLQFYQQDFPNQTLSADQYITNTTSATTVTTAVLPPETMNPTSPTSSTHMGPEGRVSKPTRRRSRASRRTPTTLLNTDTTNFRAMVQQFTGGPVAPFASPSLSLASTTPSFSALAGFGLGPRASTSLNNQAMVSAPFYHHLQQQQQNLYQAQNRQHYNNSMYNNNTQGGGGGGGEERFFQRLISPPNNDAVTDHIHGQEEGGFFPNTSS